MIAVGDSIAIRLEQANRVARLRFIEALGDQAHHLAFVVLVGTKHVEEFQAGALWRQRCAPRGAVRNHEIEQMLAPTIEVERTQPLECGRIAVVGKSLCAAAVGRGRRRVNERGALRGTPLQKLQGQAKIRFDHQIAIACRGLRDRAEMNDPIERAAIEPTKQVRRRYEVGELVLLQVAPLAVLAQRVVDHDIAAPGLIEARDDVRADKTCSTRYQQHIQCDPAFRGPPLPQSVRGCNTSYRQRPRFGPLPKAGLTPGLNSKITVNSIGWL